MANRIVYLVEKATKASKASTLEFVTDAELSGIIADGYTIESTIERKVEGVKATMMVLQSPADARSMVVREPEDDPEPPRRLARRQPEDAPRAVSVLDEFGDSRQLSIGEAMVENLGRLARGLTVMGDASHLGAPGQHNLPGMTIVSGSTVGRAFDLGLIAQKSGQPLESNPWPGTAAGTKWIEGWRAGDNDVDRVPKAALEECFQEGYDIAKRFGKNDEVHCPYAGKKKAAWCDGFRAGGGKVV